MSTENTWTTWGLKWPKAERLHNTSCKVNVIITWLNYDMKVSPLSALLVPLVRGPLWEVLMATSVTGLSADWLTVSFSDTWTTKDKMFVTAGLISATFDAHQEITHEIQRNRNQSDLVSLQKVKDFHNVSKCSALGKVFFRISYICSAE